MNKLTVSEEHLLREAWGFKNACGFVKRKGRRGEITKDPRLQTVVSYLWNRSLHLCFQRQIVLIWNLGTKKAGITDQITPFGDLSCDSALRITDFTSCSSCTFQSWRTLESQTPTPLTLVCVPNNVYRSSEKFICILYIFFICSSAFWYPQVTWQERILQKSTLHDFK